MVWNTFRQNSFTDGSAFRDQNRLTYSSLNDISINNYQAPTYGIKYVLKGTEHYILGAKDYPVSAGHFLLVNNNVSMDVAIRSRENVEGICVHLEASLMRDLQRQVMHTDEQLINDPFGMNHSPELEPLLYQDKQTRLGKHLQNLASTFQHGDDKPLAEERALYYNLGTEMLRLQTPQTQLTVMRNSTKVELLRRLSLAQTYIVDHAMHTIDIDLVAKEAMMSAPHLYRSFKKVYGISPYQFATEIRLEKGKQFLQAGLQPGEVSWMCGYADVPAFSKAFKKMFGISPSGFTK